MVSTQLVLLKWNVGSRKSADEIKKPSASLLKAMAIHSGRLMQGYMDNAVLKNSTKFGDHIQGFGLMTLDKYRSNYKKCFIVWNRSKRRETIS